MNAWEPLMSLCGIRDFSHFLLALNPYSADFLIPKQLYFLYI